MQSLLNDTVRKSRWPAKLDLTQSITGGILGLFMWAHMCLVASILFGKDAFFAVAKMLEGAFLRSTGEGYPILVTLAALTIFTIFIIHTALGTRKFPINWKQYKILRSHISMTRHGDTIMWYIQAATGFIMFFLGSVHLFIIMTHPVIDPFISADRIISESMWPLYLILLLAVELHGTIGLYRLSVKWGWFDGKNPPASRKRLKVLKTILSVFFITVGLAALLVFAKIGIDHQDQAGERYQVSQSVH